MQTTTKQPSTILPLGSLTSDVLLLKDGEATIHDIEDLSEKAPAFTRVIAAQTCLVSHSWPLQNARSARGTGPEAVRRLVSMPNAPLNACLHVRLLRAAVQGSQAEEPA